MHISDRQGAFNHTWYTYDLQSGKKYCTPVNGPGKGATFKNSMKTNDMKIETIYFDIVASTSDTPDAVILI